MQSKKKEKFNGSDFNECDFNGNLKTYTRYLDILELLVKSKKKVLDVFNGSLETHNRYSEVVN